MTGTGPPTRRLAAAAVLVALVAIAGCASVPTGGQTVTPPTANPPAGSSGAGGTSAPGTDGGGQDGASSGYTELYQRTIDSVVTIRLTTESGIVGGSGFVYDRRGHVVTNEHVVGTAEEVEVRFRDGEWRTASVVGTDTYSDLAVLHVADPPAYAEPLPIAEATPRPGERVVALGNPFGLEGSVTAGIVSGVNRSMPTDNGFSIPDTVQTDAAINPGNSGGPLVSMEGNVVGVNTAGIGAARADNVGFAVSAEIVERVVPALIREGRYDHVLMGVVTIDVTPLVAEANGLSEARGLLVVRTPAGGPAAGVLEPASSTRTVAGQSVPTGGDVIVAVDGRSVDSHQELSRYLALETRPDQTVSVTVIRNDTRRTVDLTLGTRPTA